MLKTLISTGSALRPGIIIIITILLLSGCAATQNSSERLSESFSAADKNSYQQAISDLKSGKAKAAEIKLRKLIKINPNFTNAYVNLAIILLNSNQVEQAENNLSLALKINPENIYALNHMGIIQRKKGNFSQAKELYEKALSIEPDYAYAHLNIGILYDLYFYDFSNAIKHYKKYQELTHESDQNVAKWIVDLERQLNNKVASK